MIGLDWGQERVRIVAAVRAIGPGVSIACLLAVAGCGKTGAPPDGPLALVNARVIDGTGGPAADNTTILIEAGRIALLGPTAATTLPAGIRTLDLSGKVVIPGLIDMHYTSTTGAMRYRRDAAGALDSTYDPRLAERLLRVALSRGITTVRDPGASPVDRAVALREAVDSGGVLGPRIFTAGPIISNPELSEAEIRREIARQAEAGVDYIKLYAGIGPQLLRVAVEEAHRNRLKVIGHLQRTSWTEAALAGIDYLTHGGNWHQAYVPPRRRAEYERLGGGMRARIAWLEWLDVDGPAVTR